MAQIVGDFIRNTLVEGLTVSVEFFGQFSVRQQPAHRDLSRQSGTSTVIPERRVVSFMPSNHLRAYLAQDEQTTASGGSLSKFDVSSSAFAGALAQRREIPQSEAQQIFREWLVPLLTTMKNSESLVWLPPLGFIEVKRYPGYSGRNPKTGVEIPVPGKIVPLFLPSVRLTECLNGGSEPSEVESSECALLMGTFDVTAPTLLWQKLKATGAAVPGMSIDEVGHLEDATGHKFPALLSSLLGTFSLHGIPFVISGSSCINTDTVSDLMSNFGGSDSSTAQGIPFCRLGSGDLCWYCCSCELCRDDPHVFVAQDPHYLHNGEKQGMRLSEWLMSRALVAEVRNSFHGRVLKPADAVVLLSRLSKLRELEGLPSLPI